VVELSSKSEYALLAMVELAIAYPTGEPLQIRQIAAQQSIPDRYLEQLLASLRRCGLIRSQRGAKGGYLLVRDPSNINLLEILNCIEGLDKQPVEETLNAKTLEGATVYDIWQEAGQAAFAVLHSYSLQDLAEKCKARKQLDIMYYI